jgi:hypothetical protein
MGAVLLSAGRLVDIRDRRASRQVGLPPWSGPQETLIQVHGVGPTDITFVNPADNPRKK